MAEIKLEQVAKSFGTFTAVKGVNFTVDHGSFFVILGPSGCGKTTTLRMIAGLELPTSGRILLDGEDVTSLPASARDIAFVFQLFALYPHMNVRQNIGFPLRCQNFSRSEIKKASTRRQNCCRSIICSTAGSAASRAATGSAWRSDAPSCAGPRPF
jgi:multiple sugar transport system ATP-binding protein